MLRLIATTALVVSTAITMSVTDVQADKLPASVSLQLQLATGPDQIALLAIAHPDLSVSIMEEAAVLGLASPAQIVSAAVTSEASPAMITQLTYASAKVDPLQASAVIASAAQICVLTGGEVSTEFAPKLATAAVDGVEASGALAEVVESEAAQILAALMGWCGQTPEGLARVIAAATNNLGDTPEGLLIAMSHSTGSGEGGQNQLAQNQIINIDDFYSAAHVKRAAQATEAQNNPSPN